MIKKRAILILIIFNIITSLFSQELYEDSPTKPQLDIPKISIRLDEGISFCQLTRIEKKADRSNFVRETMFTGAYISAQTVDLSFFDVIINVDIYYPVYNAFNGMKQKPRNMWNYGINTFTGLTYDYDKLKMINISAAIGMHYMFQITDEWYMHYIGIGGELGLIFPLTKNWAIVNNNFFSFDNANIGANQVKQPFDGSYQYNINLGVRYSKRNQNPYYYINTANHDNRVAARKEARAEAKEQKKLEKQNITEEVFVEENQELVENVSVDDKEIQE